MNYRHTNFSHVELLQFIMAGKSKATCSSVHKEFPCILWNFNVHYHVHKNLPHVPITSQTNHINGLPSYIYKIHSNIILSSTLRFSRWSLSFRFPHWNPIGTPYISHMYMSQLSHPPWYDHLNDDLFTVQIVKLIIMQVSAVSYYFIPLMSKYSPYHSVLNKHPQ
jgi:hypothetical protein